MTNEKDWLNNFIEQNSWGLLIAIIGVVISFTVLGARVSSAEARVLVVEEKQDIILENQKAIIQLQTKQVNIQEDVNEIKIDVKMLLKR